MTQRTRPHTAARNYFKKFARGTERNEERKRVADAAGITVATILSYEKGVRSPTLEIVPLLVEATGSKVKLHQWNERLAAIAPRAKLKPTRKLAKTKRARA